MRSKDLMDDFRKELDSETYYKIRQTFKSEIINEDQTTITIKFFKEEL